MASKKLQYRRTHNLLLISRLLSSRDNVSPFTLIQDSLRQSGWPLLKDMIGRAKTLKLKTIFLSFETLRKPHSVDEFLLCSGESQKEIQKFVSSKIESSKRCLVIFDSLHPLLGIPNINISAFLSSFMSPTSSILAVYHTDIPVLEQSPYAPHPATLLGYLSTAIFTIYSLGHILSQKEARDRSVAEPVFGLDEEIDGIIIGMGSNDRRGTVIEMEYRRKSGRGVKEWFFVAHSVSDTQTHKGPQRPKETVMLLEDHPLFPHLAASDSGQGDEEHGNATFSLGLTDRQKRDRDAVVLPYFDAQKEDGVGQGGRILYDMGVEDDFDEEEDEI